MAGSLLVAGAVGSAVSPPQPMMAMARRPINTMIASRFIVPQSQWGSGFHAQPARCRADPFVDRPIADGSNGMACRAGQPTRPGGPSPIHYTRMPTMARCCWRVIQGNRALAGPGCATACRPQERALTGFPLQARGAENELHGHLRTQWRFPCSTTSPPTCGIPCDGRLAL